MSQTGHRVEINEVDFEKDGLASDVPVLVDFFTPPCAPCKALIPVLERVAGKVPEVKVVKVNAWNNQNLCGRFKIMGVPALLFFNKGELLSRIDGFDEKTEEKVEEALKDMVEV